MSFKNFFMKGEPSKKKKKKKEQPGYYEWKKPGYIKAKHPLLEKSFKKLNNKIIMATWSENKYSNSDEEHQEMEKYISHDTWGGSNFWT